MILLGQKLIFAILITMKNIKLDRPYCQFGDILIIQIRYKHRSQIALVIGVDRISFYFFTEMPVKTFHELPECDMLSVKSEIQVIDA